MLVREGDRRRRPLEHRTVIRNGRGRWVVDHGHVERAGADTPVLVCHRHRDGVGRGTVVVVGVRRVSQRTLGAEVRKIRASAIAPVDMHLPRVVVHAGVGERTKVEHARRPFMRRLIAHGHRRRNVRHGDLERLRCGAAVFVCDCNGYRVDAVVRVRVRSGAGGTLRRLVRCARTGVVAPVDAQVPRAVVDAGVGERAQREARACTLVRRLIGRRCHNGGKIRHINLECG